MKQVKFLALALVVLMGVSFTSCMDSNGGSSYDGDAFVTVYQEFMSSAVTLKGDDGITYIPTNPSMLMDDDGNYVTRAYIYYVFAAGEQKAEGKTSYNITIKGGMGLAVADLTLRPDTIKNSFEIRDFAAWGSTTGYMTTGINANYVTGAYLNFEAYIDTVNVDPAKNMLPIVLKYTNGGGFYSTNNGLFYNSWDMSQINVTNLGLNRSENVKVRVQANTDNNTTLIEKSFDYKFNY